MQKPGVLTTVNHGALKMEGGDLKVPLSQPTTAYTETSIHLSNSH